MSKHVYLSKEYGTLKVIIKNSYKHIYIAAAFNEDNQMINTLRFTYQPSLEEIVTLFEL